VKCFFLIKFTEQWGTGTNDIVDMCVNWNLPEPLFEEITGGFAVTFRKYHLTDIMLKGLNERQKVIAEYLGNNNFLSFRAFKRGIPSMLL